MTNHKMSGAEFAIFSSQQLTRTNQEVSRCNPNALPCANCGSTLRKLGAGKTPDSNSLLCECGKFLKWVSGSELKAIAAQLNQQEGGLG